MRTIGCNNKIITTLIGSEFESRPHHIIIKHLYFVLYKAFLEVQGSSPVNNILYLYYLFSTYKWMIMTQSTIKIYYYNLLSPIIYFSTNERKYILKYLK